MRTSNPSLLSTSVLVAAMACALSLAGCTSPQRCAIGSVACACGAGDTCNVGAVCGADDRCHACVAGTVGCPCDTGDTCDTGLSCTSDNLCADSATVVCYDACKWNFDGVCDDGGPGATYSACDYGSDCSDCLARPNTCTDPDYPVYCPNTASTTSGACWSPNTDCDSIVDCAGTIYGCNAGLRYDCTTMGCVTNDCASNTYARTYCDAGAQCYPSLTDCNTVIDCGGTFSGCFVGETSACDVSNTFSCN